MIQETVQILNKRAKFEYEILDKYTAGIVLVGTEIKSIRLGKASIAESFCEFNDKGELFVINSTIEAYDFGTYYNLCVHLFLLKLYESVLYAPLFTSIFSFLR